MKSGSDDAGTVTYLITLPKSRACPVAGCPRQQSLEHAMRDAIATLEHTRHAFKSRQLGELRQRLERVLAESDPDATHA